MNALLYLAIPVAVVLGVWLGIKWRNSSRKVMAPLLSGGLAHGHPPFPDKDQSRGDSGSDGGDGGGD